MLKIEDKYIGKSSLELSKIVQKIYTEKFQGKCVLNKSAKVYIYFNAIGKSKTAFGGKRKEHQMSSFKASAIEYLDKLIENADYIGTANPKEKHIKKYKALGFLIFKAKCEINSKIYTFKICAMIREGGKIHYSINEDYEI